MSLHTLIRSLAATDPASKPGIRILVRKPHDALAGAFFILVGLLAGWISLDYSLGTAMRMGAGYFPLLVSLLLVGVGLVILLQSLGFTRTETPESLSGLVRLRPLLFICFSVIFFALTVNRLGFVLTTLLMTLLAGYAKRVTDLRRFAELLGLGAALALATLALFVYGLGVQLPAWPRF